MKTLFLPMLLMLFVGLQSCEKTCDCKCPKTEQKTLTLQPGPDGGQDCSVVYKETDGGVAASTNNNALPELLAFRWTFDNAGAGEGTSRSYLKFTGLSAIAQNASIKSAKLSLYGLSTGIGAPQGNSGSTETWLKRATENWDESTITWNNKPSTTDVNQVALPFSTSQWNFNILDIDVTNLVRDMISNNQNYGFVFQLQTEQIYRNIGFGSSEHDASIRPKLVVEYEVTN